MMPPDSLIGCKLSLQFSRRQLNHHSLARASTFNFDFAFAATLRAFCKFISAK
jgi:hypothetical protein